ncbi:MAG TPA: hypothetical protein VM165_24040 [Planctomycetaceae bacterium]|nr:hypothetical protein [Planctomycetaceae bacterium]
MTTSPADSPPFSRLRTLAAWLVFVTVAVASTWPLVTQIDSVLPLGSETVATVPLLNVWTVWWNADRAAAKYERYWDAPIFHPTRTTFVFSEAQPTTVVVAPLIWLTGRPALGYNVYLLAALALNGGLTFHLLRRCGLSDWPALMGGVLTQLLPFVCWQLGVLQLVQLWPTVWTLWAILRWTEHPRWRTAIETGVAFGVTYASCNYYGLFAAMLLAPSGLWLLRRRFFTVRCAMQFLLAGGVAGALLWPMVSLQRRTATEQGWEREEPTVIALSAHLRDYTDTPWSQWLDGWELPAPNRTNVWVLGPGWVKLLTAGLGAMLGLAFPSRRRWTLLALTLGVLALFYSLGPNAEFWNLSLYRGLRRFVPGLSQIRSPFRFAVFVQLAVGWLCAECLHGSHPRHWWPRWAERCGRCRTLCAGLAWLPMLLLSGALVAETLPTQQALYPLAVSEDLPLWVTFLRDETPPGVPVICLPVAKGSSVYDYAIEARWMAWTMSHQRPLLNGYSGYFPDSYISLNAELDHFPQQGVPRLGEMGARYAVVDRSIATVRQLARHPATKDWEWLFTDVPAGIDIYRLPERLSGFDTAPATPPALKDRAETDDRAGT